MKIFREIIWDIIEIIVVLVVVIVISTNIYLYKKSQWIETAKTEIEQLDY
jgi:regulator of protease activity HflC (stomatin/prohibitin superfamily)